MKPLCIDLFCGLGGWTEGFLAEGYRVVGFDIEIRPYPAQLVIQDVLTLRGSQFKSADVIVASPPCQAYSYRAMPWKRAKALPPPSNELFESCFRIQLEASEAAGRYVPLLVENVRGAQPWVGRAKWHYGSFYLWGDVPVLMPPPARHQSAVDSVKVHGLNWGKYGEPDYKAKGFNVTAAQRWKDGRKGLGGGWFEKPYKERGDITGRFNSKSDSRKAASAQIAKIPFPLAQYVARYYKPCPVEVAV